MLTEVLFNIYNVTVTLNYLSPLRIFSFFLSYFCQYSNFVKSFNMCDVILRFTKYGTSKVYLLLYFNCTWKYPQIFVICSFCGLKNSMEVLIFPNGLVTKFNLDISLIHLIGSLELILELTRSRTMFIFTGITYLSMNYFPVYLSWNYLWSLITIKKMWS